MTGSVTARINHPYKMANSQAAIWIIDDNAQFSDALASYMAKSRTVGLQLVLHLRMMQFPA